MSSGVSLNVCGVRVPAYACDCLHLVCRVYVPT